MHTINNKIYVVLLVVLVVWGVPVKKIMKEKKGREKVSKRLSGNVIVKKSLLRGAVGSLLFGNHFPISY